MTVSSPNAPTTRRRMTALEDGVSEIADRLARLLGLGALASLAHVVPAAIHLRSARAWSAVALIACYLTLAAMMVGRPTTRSVRVGSLAMLLGLLGLSFMVRLDHPQLMLLLAAPAEALLFASCLLILERGESGLPRWMLQGAAALVVMRGFGALAFDTGGLWILGPDDARTVPLPHVGWVSHTLYGLLGVVAFGLVRAEGRETAGRWLGRLWFMLMLVAGAATLTHYAWVLDGWSLLCTVSAYVALVAVLALGVVLLSRDGLEPEPLAIDPVPATPILRPCPTCRQPLAEEAWYCPHCQTQTPPPKLRCHGCQALLPLRTDVCPHCATSLVTAAEPGAERRAPPRPLWAVIRLLLMWVLGTGVLYGLEYGFDRKALDLTWFGRTHKGTIVRVVAGHAKTAQVAFHVFLDARDNVVKVNAVSLRQVPGRGLMLGWTQQRTRRDRCDFARVDVRRDADGRLTQLSLVAAPRRKQKKRRSIQYKVECGARTRVVREASVGRRGGGVYDPYRIAVDGPATWDRVP